MAVKKECNLGTMTQAAKTNGIKNVLRKHSMCWKPIQEAKRLAKRERIKIPLDTLYHSPTKVIKDRELSYLMMNTYECSICKKHVNEKTYTFEPIKIKSGLGYKETNKIKLRSNVAVDHIYPVVTSAGFRGWSEYIERLFDEEVSSYRLLCKKCHLGVSNDELKERKDYDK